MSRRALLVLSALLVGCDTPPDPLSEGADLEESELADLSRTKDQGGRNGEFNYCKGATACVAGEGDCDIDAHCDPGLVCGLNNGGQFGFQWSRDVCVEPSCSNGVQDAGESGIDIGANCGGSCGGLNGDQEGYCTPGCPCAEGEGDCDSNAECVPGLTCVNNQGDRFGPPLESDDDVCMGTLGIAGLLVGDLVISEIMNNPRLTADSFGEYFEVTNTTALVIDLNGLIVRKNAGNLSFTIGVSLVAQPGEALVFTRNGNTALNGGVVEDFDYPNTYTLADVTDSIVLDNGPTDIDRVLYNNTWPNASGNAMELDVFTTEGDNNVPINWCSSNTALPSGDNGSPGAANRNCP